jgi:hypothetical protein
MRYTALTTTGPFDIGEFADQDSAQAWAAQRFGDDLQAVMVQQNDTVTVTAEPYGITGGGAIVAGALVWFGLSALSKPRRKTR